MSKATSEQAASRKSYMTGLVTNSLPYQPPFTAEKFEIFSADQWPLVIKGSSLQNGKETRNIKIWLRQTYSDGLYNIPIGHQNAIITYKNYGDYYSNCGTNDFVKLTVTDNGKRLTGNISGISMLNTYDRSTYMAISFDVENTNEKIVTSLPPKPTPNINRKHSTTYLLLLVPQP